jgi:hypothetical protein
MWTSTLASKGFPAYGDQLLLCAKHNTLMNHTFNFIFFKGKNKNKNFAASVVADNGTC